MIVRHPTNTELERAAEVAAIAFPNLPAEHWQNEFPKLAKAFGLNFILVVELDGQIVSSMVCCPQPVYIGGEPVPHSSAGAVGTIPEARCKGCAGAMMTKCVEVLREEGIYLSSLWPFSYEYYRKFGWEVGSEIRSYSASAAFFAGLGNASCVRGAANEDLPAIKAAYNKFAPGYNCLTVRSDDWWQTMILNYKQYKPLAMVTEPGESGVVVHTTNGAVDAYAMYRLSKPEEKLKIDVREIIYSSVLHRRDMLAMLASIDSDADIAFGAPIDDLFFYEIPNPRAVKTEVHASFQFRVIDPEKAILALKPEEHASGKLSFNISDPVFKEGFNFGIEIDGGNISLCKPGNNMIETDVQTLAKLYSGYLPPLYAYELGKMRVSGDTSAVLRLATDLFSPLTPYRSWLEPG